MKTELPGDQSPPAPGNDIVSLDQYRVERFRYGGKCNHRNVTKTVDMTDRKVRCSACDMELDPFECMLEISLEHERIRDTWAHLRARIKEGEKRLEEIKRLIRNAKSAARRGQVEIRPWLAEVDPVARGGR